jgi:hypothetical protein
MFLLPVVAQHSLMIFEFSSGLDYKLSVLYNFFGAELLSLLVCLCLQFAA